MPLVPCRACGHQVDTSALACPRCGATDPSRKISRQQLEEIAKQKMVDLNAYDLDAACRIVEGTARSMGIEIG